MTMIEKKVVWQIIFASDMNENSPFSALWEIPLLIRSSWLVVFVLDILFLIPDWLNLRLWMGLLWTRTKALKSWISIHLDQLSIGNAMDHGAKPFKNEKNMTIWDMFKIILANSLDRIFKSKLTSCPHNEKYLYHLLGHDGWNHFDQRKSGVEQVRSWPPFAAKHPPHLGRILCRTVFFDFSPKWPYIGC